MLSATVTTTATPEQYLASSGALAVDPGLTVNSTSGTVDSAVVQVGTNFHSGEDVLAFNNQLGISGSYDATSGTLTLSGTASAAAYQLALRSVTYTDSAAMPTGTSRTITFTLTQGGNTTIDAGAQRTINLSSLLTNGTLALTSTGTTVTTEVKFTSATQFVVIQNGTQIGSYDTSTIDHVVFTGAATTDTFIYSDSFNPLTASATMKSAHVNSSNAFLDVSNSANIYIYGNSQSSAVLDDVSGAFFMVGVSGPSGNSGNYNGTYDYLAGSNQYSEVASFQDVVGVGVATPNYAYIYSTGGATATGNSISSDIIVGSQLAISVNTFPQQYIVGASDGSDHITLNSSGGQFVASSSADSDYAYITNTSGLAPAFFVLAFEAQNIVGNSSGAGDTAYFYSAAGNNLTFGQSQATIAGSNNAVSNFTIQANNFKTVYALASNTANEDVTLQSSGNGTLVSASNYVTLSAGGTMIEVIGYKSVTANGSNSSNTANLYDAAGSNVLTAAGSQAELVTPIQTVIVNNFASVLAYDVNGTNDVAHVSSVDYALQLIGNWMQS